jgi:small subunit ribosomal protein S4e
MSSKGENKKAKAVSAPKSVRIHRKEGFWTIRTKAGPHNKSASIALGIILRDFAGITSTLKETKHVLQKGEVKVNGVVRKNHQFPAGLFDVVAVEKQKLFFRVMLDSKGRLIANPLEKESKEKISKVINKTMTSKGVQLTTNDGRTYYGVKANIGDSLKIGMPQGKIEEVLEFKEGALAYITKGAHCSSTATIKAIVPGTARKDKLVKFTIGKQELETVAGSIFVIGKGKPAVEGI